MWISPPARFAGAHGFGIAEPPARGSLRSRRQRGKEAEAHVGRAQGDDRAVPSARGNFNLLVLRLLDHRAEVVVPAVADQFRRAPGLLRNAPIVLGLSDLEADPAAVDFAALVRGLRAAEINPIGTTGGSPRCAPLPRPRGWRCCARPPRPRPHRRRLCCRARRPGVLPCPPPPAPGTQRPTLLVEQNIRAGQRIWAEGADCIVLGAVNAGGEVIADGHLHIYGPLRGRAIAGGGHNTEARIFALHFDPELVSIAGFYATREQLGNAPIGKAVHGAAARRGAQFRQARLGGIGMAEIIVVTSGKGGVGKTTTSAAFATGLALAGKRTVVIDFDVGLRNLDLIMGVERRVVFDIINVIQGEARG